MPTIFFHFVTASSQIAAVPIQIGWLLGGILLGLEIQALAGQNRSRAPSGCTRGGGGYLQAPRWNRQVARDPT